MAKGWPERLPRRLSDDGIRLDPPEAMLPLARPMRSNEERRLREATTTYAGAEVRANYPELDHRDQSLLLALLAFAGERGEIQRPAEGDGLRASGLVLGWPVVDVSVSVDELVQRAGWTSQHATRATYKALDRALTRLHQVVITATKKDPDTGRAVERYRTSLIHASHDKIGGRISVRLCARLASAITGGHHVRYLLSERRELKSPAAQVLHVWLSGWLRASGEPRRISLAALGEKLWPGRELERHRRSQLRQALREIDALPSWSITVGRDGFASLRRTP